MARPRFHLLTTAPVAWSAYRRWGPGPALALLTTGIFVDLDHLVDYAWVRFRGSRSHYLAPLHAWELVLAAGLLALWARRRRNGYRVMAGLTAGLVLHLVQDVLTNRPRHSGVYLLAYRLAHRFDRDRIGWEKHATFHEWSGRPWYTWI